MIVALLDIMALLWNVLEHMPSGNLLRFATRKPIKRTVHNFLVVGSGKQTRISVSGHGVGSRTKYVGFFSWKSEEGPVEMGHLENMYCKLLPTNLGTNLGMSLMSPAITGGIVSMQWSDQLWLNLVGGHGVDKLTHKPFHSISTVDPLMAKMVPPAFSAYNV